MSELSAVYLTVPLVITELSQIESSVKLVPVKGPYARSQHVCNDRAKKADREAATRRGQIGDGAD